MSEGEYLGKEGRKLGRKEDRNSQIYFVFSNRYVSCVVGCPYEGSVSPNAVAEVSTLFFGGGTGRDVG